MNLSNVKIYVKNFTKTHIRPCYIFTNKQKRVDTNVKRGIIYA